MTDTMNDTAGVPRVAPNPTSFSRPFWEATRERRLLVQFCPGAGKYQFFPRPTSIFTGRRDLEWREVSGRGEVFTYTVIRRAPPAFRGHEPYLIATVTLDVGVNVIGNLVRCGLDEVRIGMAVAPYWSPLPNGFNLLMFQPDPGMTGRAVFLDRDGVVNALVQYPPSELWEAPRRAEDFRPLPGALDAMAALVRSGYRLVVVSNQPNQALGKASAADHAAIHQRLLAALDEAGIPLAAAYYCLHHPSATVAELRGPCACRKPSPHFLLRARDEHGLDLAESWMVGDRETDVLAGIRAGVRTIRIGPDAGDPAADLAAPDLGAAARGILKPSLRTREA